MRRTFGVKIVLQFRKPLVRRPELPASAAVMEMRNYQPGDFEHWEAVRKAAFAGEEPGGRDWSAEDFEREFLNQPWWSPARQWFAIVDGQPAGTVTLGQRKELPVVHWLMVLPAYRRQQVATRLLYELETFCWHAGWREIRLETHRNWQAAVAFYRRSGYAEVE